MKRKTFQQGGHIPHYKSLTESKPIEHMAIPDEVVIPLSQHIGAPCQPLADVSVGERVTIGQPIGMGKGLCAPVHATVSGVVIAIEERPHVSNRCIPSIVIKKEGPQEFSPGPETDLESLTPGQIVEIIGEAGIVGMGGAGFPTKVKLSPPAHKPIDTIILNGAECEPFLTADHRYMLERAEDVIFGLKAIMKAVNAKQAFIGIEDNKPDAIAHLSALVQDNSAIEIVPLETKYPQGGEKQLIYAVIGKEVPTGGLPMDVGAIVQNIGTAVAIAEALKQRKPLIERVVTVSGPGVQKPGNYMVRIGTPLSFVLSECGATNIQTSKTIVGGPMTGMAQLDLAAPVIKTTSGILLFPADFARQQLTYTDCVRCGNCVEQCPMYLYPNDLSLYGEAQKYSDLDRCNILDCIECGLCSFVCPANRPIVQFIKVSKPHIWELRNKATGS